MPYGRDLSRFSRTLTFTDVTVGDKKGYGFNGTTSKIDCGSTDFIGTGPITVSCWIKLTSFGENDGGRIIDNGRYILYISSVSSRLNFTSNGVTTVTSATNSIVTNTWYFIIATRNASGTANLYINGVLSGTANQNSGTPEAATTNIFIGNRNALDRTFDGLISSVKIYNEVKTAIWAKNEYLRTRNLY